MSKQKPDELVRSTKRNPMYSVWKAMMTRCFNPKRKDYSRYGGAGIVVCPRWQSFECFIEDVGERPPGMQLDRINNNGNYEPGNVRWATAKEQQRNKSSSSILEHNGKAQTAAEWAEETGLSQQRIHQRMAAGWSTQETLSTPARSKRPSRKAA